MHTTIPKWFFVTCSAIAAIAALGVTLGYSSIVFRVFTAPEELNKRVTKLEETFNTIGTRLSSIEVTLRGDADNFHMLDRSLTELSTGQKAISDMLLSTWKETMANSERVKNTQIRVDGIEADISALEQKNTK